MCWRILFGCGFFFNSAYATLVQPSDEPYFSQRRGDTNYIYDESSRAFIDQLAGYNQAFHKMYEASFHWKLDEHQDLILTSQRQQIANAYATTFPNIKSVWYPAGAGLLQSIAESSWLLTLAAHETSHLYQLDSKGPVGRTLKPIFGNTTVIFPLLWPVFLQTGFVLPTSILEGNAVLNESRVDMGGRLQSGEMRALVLAQVAAGDMSAERLINDELKFPFGTTPYMQGGYFQAHLASKYGIEKTNRFFLAQSEHYLWPLILSRTFRDHFGTSYYQEVHEYLHEISSLATRQRQSEGEALVTTTFNEPFNHDDSRVYWLSTKGEEPPLLHIYDKASRRLTSRQMDLPLGQVFLNGDKPVVAAADQRDLHHLEYSLYGEGAAVEERWLGQIVTDRRAGHTVALDARQSWLDPHVLVDGETYDIGHSNPVLDDQGAVYYFRQNGAERILYRNRQPVFKYEGFYGKLTEVSADGTIYFIANTDFGSTLYRYKQNQITRMLDSDRVVDARRLSDWEFLVNEVGTQGHRVLVASAAPRLQNPVRYNYGFVSATVAPEAPESAPAEAERSYSATREMRYNGLDFNSTFSGHEGLAASWLASFSDPLDFQNFNLGYTGVMDRGQQALVRYAFTKYLPQFYTEYWFRNERWRQVNDAYRQAYDQRATLGVSLPILRHHRWNAEVGVAVDYQREDLRLDPGAPVKPAPAGRFDETFGTLSDFTAQWAVPTVLGFYNWREFDFSLRNQLDAQDWRKKHNTSQAVIKYVHGFRDGFFATGIASYAWAENNNVDVKYDPYPLIDRLQVQRLTPHGDYQVRNAGVARLEVTKALWVQAYSSRLPIGVHRLAPLVVVQGVAMDVDANHRYPPNLFEVGYGADIEFLLFHKATAVTRILDAYDTRDPRYHDAQVNLNYKQTF